MGDAPTQPGAAVVTSHDYGHRVHRRPPHPTWSSS